MNLTFDYYHNLEKVELRLCNPDGRELYPLPGRNRHLTLRFNDLSELTFDVGSKITLSNGEIVNLEAYDYVQTKRLVFVTDIGWFQISDVKENDNGVEKTKSVTAESLQAVLKNKGFLSEERVYCFFNPNDPTDSYYDASQGDALPSVLGQLSKQLGIRQAFDIYTGYPTGSADTVYPEWTVTYVNQSLFYRSDKSKCRTFKEEVTYGYDWIINSVANAFEVIVLFDFLHKSIQIMAPDEVATHADVIYTFNNFMKEVTINESSEDIVTVLNCNGDNCDISSVNVTGTNYICDFSYFMDEKNHRWMSQELIDWIKAWEAHCNQETVQTTYNNRIENLHTAAEQRTLYDAKLQMISTRLQDLKNAQAKRSVVGAGTPGARCGIVITETVKRDGLSVDSTSNYHEGRFSGNTYLKCYVEPPEYYPPDDSHKTGYWCFPDNAEYRFGTADTIVTDNLSDDNQGGVYWYFCDANSDTDMSSYCRLRWKAIVNQETLESTFLSDGYDRYVALAYPKVDNSGKVTYTDSIQAWIDRYENLVDELNAQISECDYDIASNQRWLQFIAMTSNIFTFFANNIEDAVTRDRLLRELNCYWIEGEYTNENISVLDNTTFEDSLDLSRQLLLSGQKELRKVCQPRFKFSLESVDVTKQYEFRHQMHALELGKIITIEKEEGLWYYPALLEISIDLDDSNSFSMTFANATRLDDWGYTYADLIANASSTSRKISANWQDFLAYSKDRAVVNSLIKNPLDATLRASLANMTNQEFVVDTNGILGRKHKRRPGSPEVELEEFEDEQVRLINNSLIFTDDNWETAKTALGKIYYTDADGNEVTSYGLIAETIIGSLIMGENLKIKNDNSTIELGQDGIVIKKPIYASDNSISEYKNVFQAKPDGSLAISAPIAPNTWGDIFTVGENGAYIKNLTIDGKLKFKDTEYYIGIDGDSYLDLPGLNVNKDKAEFSGTLSAPAGTIGGFTISNGSDVEGEEEPPSLSGFVNVSKNITQAISLSPISGIRVLTTERTTDGLLGNSVTVDSNGLSMSVKTTDPGSVVCFLTLTVSGEYPDDTYVHNTYHLYVDDGGIVRALVDASGTA